MKDQPQLGQKINATIQRLGIHGEGIGYWHGFTLFIDGALPGETVQARVIEKKQRYGRASLEHIDTVSPERVVPVCPLFERCGGCQVMHLSYPAQLEVKRQRVLDALERIAKIPDVPVLSCLPSPQPLNYRNKIQVPIRSGPEGLQIGFYARNSHNLVEVEECYIHCPLGQKVYAEALALLKSSDFTAFDWNTGKGDLRYMIIKTAVNTEELLVILVTSAIDEEKIAPFAESLMQKCPEVKGVMQNINDAMQNVVLGDKFHLIAGQDSIEEEILGLRFKVSPASFFQVNPYQAERLYQTALEYAELTGEEHVLDAFCGVGTLSLLFARHAKQVTGVECVPQAIQDARENARLNHIENAVFVLNEAETWIKSAKRIDVALLNPPRKGCDPDFIKELGRLKPARIVYISCDPATLARDLALLRQMGWSIDTVQPMDMFPQTAHVETIVKLSLKV